MTDVLDLTRGKPMATSIDCREPACWQSFTGPGMWNAYARHLRTAHPQTIPTPPQRAPEPPAEKRPAAIAGRKEAPAMGELKCPECGQTFQAAKGLGSHRRYKHGTQVNGGGPVVSERAPIAPPAASTRPALLTRTERISKALDKFGWHLDGCPAYDQALGDGLAADVDNQTVECACGFRSALREAIAS